jgi:hypothetical protein
VPYGYTHTPERRLICANTRDSVRQLKETIVSQYALSSTTDIILAETFECHVSKILVSLLLFICCSGFAEICNVI